MIDIDELEWTVNELQMGGKKVVLAPEDTLALIAEIRRLREHRKCPCGGDPEVMKWRHGRRSIKCDICDCSTDYFDTPEEAWAAWDGVA